MKSDFDMIHHTFDNDITVYGVSDLHIGAPEHMEKEWGSFCQKILKEENTYIILGGDLINNSTRSSVANVFEETMRPRDQKRKAAEKLAPLKDRVLAIVPGNHERRSVKDADDEPIYDIACKLDIEDVYRENFAVVHINMGEKGGYGKTNPSYTIFVTHGAGGGMLTGGAVNRNERFGYVLDGVDLLMVGHTHKPFITQPSKIMVDPRNGKVSIRPFKVVSMTSWLSYGGYAAQKMLLPSSHALQKIKLYRYKKQIDVTM